MYCLLRVLHLSLSNCCVSILLTLLVDKHAALMRVFVCVAHQSLRIKILLRIRNITLGTLRIRHKHLNANANANALTSKSPKILWPH